MDPERLLPALTMAAESRRELWTRWLAQSAAGAGLGLLLFLVESRLIVSGNAVEGLNVDTQGPFSVFLAAVRPQLPWLLSRVATAYALAGGVLGMLAATGAAVLGEDFPRARWPLFFGEYVFFWALMVWDRAVSRPALFDDLPPLRGVLSFLVDRGDRWAPSLVACALLTAHGGVALVRWRPFAWRRAVAVAGGVLALLALGGAGLRAEAPPEKAGAKPKLVLIVGIDAFRPDRVEGSPEESPVAPNLERFLADATRFDRAYTPIAQTAPAWRSLLTADWPWKTGVRYPLSADFRKVPLPTFAGWLAREGYQTTFATDCSRFNYLELESGFTERLEPPRGAINFLLEKLRYRGLGLFADNAAGAWLLPEFVDNRALAGIYDPMGYAERLAGTLVTQAKRGPTLFAFHSTAAHFPGDPVYPFYRKYVDGREPLERRLRMYFAPLVPQGQGARDGWNTRGTMALYDELLSQGDAQLGVLLDRLKDEGLYDEAMIIVFSDHGENFFQDHPELAGGTPVHGARLGEDENRILFAIKLPKSQQPRTVATPRVVHDLVRLIDLGPTVLDVVGAEPMGRVDGVSLKPLLRDRPLPPLKLYAETGFTHATPNLFDPGHFTGGARDFDAYEVLPDGRVQMNPRAHEVAMREKDVGAFDGDGWVIRAPHAAGRVVERCEGRCSPALRTWFDQAREKDPLFTW